MSSSGNSTGVSNGGGLIFAGIVIVAITIAALSFCIRKFRIFSESSGCSFNPAVLVRQLYSENHLHWKSNLLYICNIIMAFLIVPCSIHLSVCVNGDISDACAWSLTDLETNSSVYKSIGLPAHGAVGFGLAAIIIEMLLSVVVAMLSLRWHSESNLNPEEDGGHNHLRTELEASDEVQSEWKWVLWTRWFSFAIGVWVFVFGILGRCFVYALLHTYEAHGVPYLDSYSYGEIVCVIIFSFIHFITYIGMCCRKTFGEHQNMNGDYAAFVCGTCSGSKVLGNTNEKCPSCSGRGLVYEIQNCHHSTPILDNKFPIDKDSINIKMPGRK